MISGIRPRRADVGEVRGLTDGLWVIMEACWSQDRMRRPALELVRLQLVEASLLWE